MILCMHMPVHVLLYNVHVHVMFMYCLCAMLTVTPFYTCNHQSRGC